MVVQTLGRDNAMQCANPDCAKSAHDLTTGSLRLIELDVPPEQRVSRSDWGFPICSVPSRYFWLCERCCQFLSIRRWTKQGVILEHREKEDVRHLSYRKTPASLAQESVTEKTA